ncbi:MAG: hypothetical protein N3G74_02380 [Candidatus Micrarchaeota archaeon]|nr:hypothetical protein [Candidatus Micrarchaeota archaeon]
MEQHYEKLKKIWKIAIAAVIIGVLFYLMQQILSDARWSFVEDATSVILFITILIIVGYILKEKRKKTAKR